MLHALYLIAFTSIAFLAVGNLIRSLLTMSANSDRRLSSPKRNRSFPAYSDHPELLDANGNAIEEPLLVMRSISVEDARQRLNQIYEASPGTNKEISDEG